MGLGSAHAAPILIVSGGEPAALQRVSLGSADHKGEEREAFIQSLVHDHPEVIPMADIAPPFMPLVSVCKVLPTSAGESGEGFYWVIRLARKSSSHPAVFRLSRREAFPGANRIRFCAICLIVQKLAGA